MLANEVDPRHGPNLLFTHETRNKTLYKPNAPPVCFLCLKAAVKEKHCRTRSSVGSSFHSSSRRIPPILKRYIIDIDQQQR